MGDQVRLSGRPGRFSKNFAWHGTGLSKLHRTIRAGFASELTPVSRSAFRAKCGINDPNLQLIPINFFLFKKIMLDRITQAAGSARRSERDRLVPEGKAVAQRR